MNDLQVLDDRTRAAKNLVQVCYALHALGWIFTLGTATLISVIINYIKRPDAVNTFAYSHHNWLIRTFWWSIVWGAVNLVFFLTFIGIPLAIVGGCILFVWLIYRLVKGWLRLNENREVH